MALPIVDARSGKLIQIGQVVQFGPNDWYRLMDLGTGVFTAVGRIETPRGTQDVVMPIKYWPRKLTYGPRFVTDAWRVVLVPS